MKFEFNAEYDYNEEINEFVLTASREDFKFENESSFDNAEMTELKEKNELILQ